MTIADKARLKKVSKELIREFRENCRDFMAGHHMTKVEFADFCGLSYNEVKNFFTEEGEKRNPPLFTVVMIGVATGISIYGEIK